MSSSDSSASSNRSNDRKKRYRKRHKERKHGRDHKKHKHKKRRRSYSSGSSADGSDNGRKSRKREREHSKRHRKGSDNKKDKKAHKQSRKKDILDMKQKSKADIDPRALRFARALVQLFQSYPDMASDLPAMLIRMGSGTGFDLRQIQMPSLRQYLEGVFECLEFCQVELDASGSWVWNHPVAKKPGNDLALVKIVHSLLDSAGITLDAVDRYEAYEKQTLENENDVNKNREAMANSVNKGGNIIMARKKAAALRMLINMFTKFSPMGLAPSEVKEMLEMVSEHLY